MAIIPINIEDEEIEKDVERKDIPEGVELLASMFIPSPDGSVFAPSPNIADMFDEDTLLKVGRQVKEGHESDWDSMGDWRDLVEFGLELAKQEITSKSTPWEGAANFKSPELMNAEWRDFHEAGDLMHRVRTAHQRGFEFSPRSRWEIGRSPDELAAHRGHWAVARFLGRRTSDQARVGSLA